jgi:hypothetical protein
MTQTQPDRAPFYLRIESARLGAAMDAARAMLEAKGLAFNTGDLVIAAVALLELSRSVRSRETTPERVDADPA